MDSQADGGTMMLEAKSVNEALGVQIPIEMMDRRLTGVSTPIYAVLALVQERGRAAALYAPLGAAR